MVFWILQIKNMSTLNELDREVGNRGDLIDDLSDVCGGVNILTSLGLHIIFHERSLHFRPELCV